MLRTIFQRSVRRVGGLVLVVTVVLGALLIPTNVMAAPAPVAQESVATPGISSYGHGCANYHTVTRGQTLSGIARYYGVSTWAIASANGISNPNHIYVGQTLCIPSGGGGYYPPPPDGGGRPCGYYQNCYQPAPACNQYHVVRYGETLSGIARRCGTSVHALMSLNGLWNPNYLVAGCTLRIY
jgi:LysM repeat protein